MRLPATSIIIPGSISFTSIKNKILNHSLKLPEPPAQPGVFFEQKGAARVCRGGGWNDFAKHLRSAYRSSQMPGDAFRSRGFRLARNK